MAKVKKQSKTQKQQRQKEEALKAQSNVRGFSAPTPKAAAVSSVVDKKTEANISKFALPITQIKQDLIKTEIFIVITVAVIIWLQRTQFLFDKFSSWIKF